MSLICFAVPSSLKEEIPLDLANVNRWELNNWVLFVPSFISGFRLRQKLKDTFPVVMAEELGSMGNKMTVITISSRLFDSNGEVTEDQHGQLACSDLTRTLLELNQSKDWSPSFGLSPIYNDVIGACITYTQEAGSAEAQVRNSQVFQMNRLLAGE